MLGSFVAIKLQIGRWRKAECSNFGHHLILLGQAPSLFPAVRGQIRPNGGKDIRVTELIFDGLKVIDCASFIAGPAAATVMSDFGAAVVKIEPPGAGDPYRRRAVPVPERPLNPGFILDARNKRSLALDLRSEAGRAVLYRLVRGADVFITNYPPPV